MNIAIDFDDTYTQDPDLWFKFIDQCYIAEHNVWIVTARPDDGDNFDIESSRSVLLQKVNVIYTGYQPKRNFCKKLGIEIDVWIDDSPEVI